jgi:hypothetical protein
MGGSSYGSFAFVTKWFQKRTVSTGTHLKFAETTRKTTKMTINCFKAAIQTITSCNRAAIDMVLHRSNVNCGDAIQLYTEAIKIVQETLVATITDPNSACEHQCHLHLLPHMISVSAHRTSHQQECNLVDSSTESSLALPPNALPIYNCLFDLQINYFKDDDTAAAAAAALADAPAYKVKESDLIGVIGGILLYNIGTLYAIMAPSALLATSMNNAGSIPSLKSRNSRSYWGGRNSAFGSSPSQVMHEWMGRAVALLKSACEVLLLEGANSRAGLLSHTRENEIDSIVYFVQLAIWNNLAHLHSHFICLQQVRHCLSSMRQTMLQYRSSLLSSPVMSTEMHRLDQDAIVFEMNLFLLCDCHQLSTAPAA